jgi:hypothetical protein
VYRALELPLPKTLTYASKDFRRRWCELIARYMPFDLVIDEQTADGQPARVSKTSVAGSWGAVAGSLRYFADRFGVPRASIEGTTLSYDLVREHAIWGPPTIQLAGDGRRQGLVIARRLQYFGFELETEVEPTGAAIPADLRSAARDLLADALLAGETRHPDQGRLTQALGALRELFCRSGGTLEAGSEPQLRDLVRRQLEDVDGWNGFLSTRVSLDPARLVPADTRRALEALPSMARLRGDAVPIEYEVERGVGVARLWLREGQAKRIGEDELPRLDRPLRLGVVREEGPVLAPTLAELRERLAALLPSERRTERERRGPRNQRRPGRRPRGR